MHKYNIVALLFVVFFIENKAGNREEIVFMGEQKEIELYSMSQDYKIIKTYHLHGALGLVFIVKYQTGDRRAIMSLSSSHERLLQVMNLRRVINDMYQSKVVISKKLIILVPAMYNFKFELKVPEHEKRLLQPYLNAFKNITGVAEFTLLPYCSMGNSDRYFLVELSKDYALWTSFIDGYVTHVLD